MIRSSLYRLMLGLNRPAARELRLMRRAQWLSHSEVLALREGRLETILEYAYQHVPYYRDLMERAGVKDGGRLRLERFADLPTLDKPIIRKHFRDLASNEVGRLHVRENRTSGSTGEPLVVLQGRDEVRVSGGAVTRLFWEWQGAMPGDREMKLWGSERDLFKGHAFSLEDIRSWASGVKVINAFRMSPERMRDYIHTLETFRPKVFRGYASSLYELAQFAADEGLEVRSPVVVISSAGTLYPPMREKMASVFGCGVFNHYGSREMHSMAMECPAGRLHVSALTHLVEVIDDSGRSCPPGVEGDLVITALLNRAMPLVRYRIGDRGALADDNDCPCGRGLPVLARLSGRRVDHFWTREGRIVPGEYFIYLFVVHLPVNPITKYQVVQDDYDTLRVRLVLRPGTSLDREVRRDIEESTRLMMGASCSVDFEFLDDIPPASSGKYFYTHCSIPGRAQPTARGEEPSPHSK